MKSIILASNGKDMVLIREGQGDNLTQEDLNKGFVDYIMIDQAEIEETADYDEYSMKAVGGKYAACVLLEEFYQDKFTTKDEVVDYLIQTEWLTPDFYAVYAL